MPKTIQLQINLAAIEFAYLFEPAFRQKDLARVAARAKNQSEEGAAKFHVQLQVMRMRARRLKRKALNR
jgi:hypothetical protein